MVVKVQPDDADWDAGDVRYNVLRWTSSPNPPFGGYGPSFVNPRTGEILGADIMLEYVHFTNRVYYDRIFNTAATVNFTAETEAEEKVKFFQNKNNHLFCSKGHLMHENTLFGKYSFIRNRSFRVRNGRSERARNEIFNNARNWSYIRVEPQYESKSIILTSTIGRCRVY